MSEIKTVPFFRSYWKAIQRLNNDDRLLIFDSIMSYAFDGIYPDLTDYNACIWDLIEPNLSKSVQKAIANIDNGKKGGRKPNGNPTETQLEPNLNPSEKRIYLLSGMDKDILDYRLDRESKSLRKFPTLEEVKGFCLAENLSIDPSTFFNYYSANGWVDGNGNTISDWKAKLKTWETRERKPTKNSEEERDYSCIHL